MTGSLAYFGMHPFLHYYAFFFFGLAALSSVPLALVEVTKVLGFPAVTEVLKVAFAVAFLAIRTVYWPIVSYGFWQDVLPKLQDGSIHSNVAAGVFLVANVGLTALQLFWTTLILGGIKDMAQGKKAKHS